MHSYNLKHYSTQRYLIAPCSVGLLIYLTATFSIWLSLKQRVITRVHRPYRYGTEPHGLPGLHDGGVDQHGWMPLSNGGVGQRGYN